MEVQNVSMLHYKYMTLYDCKGADKVFRGKMSENGVCAMAADLQRGGSYCVTWGTLTSTGALTIPLASYIYISVPPRHPGKLI